MKFNDLSIREKAAVIKLGIGGGLHTLLEIQLFYDGLKGPDDPPVVQKVNKSKADFVQRLKDKDRAYIQDWENPDNIATHKLSWVEDDNGAIVYPNVQNVNGRLVDFSRTPYSTWAGYDNAVRNGDTVRMTPLEAEWFTTHYKDYYPGFNEYMDGGPVNNLKKKIVKYKINKATNNLGISELRNRLYNNIDPYDYYGNALRDFNKAVKNEKAGKIIREDKELANAYNLTNNQINVADEIFAQYLLIPNEKRHTNLRLSKSKYNPTQSNSENVYYSLPLEDKDIQNLISERFSSDYELPLFSREVKETPHPINIGLNKLSSVLGNYNLGTHTVGRGYDDKGEYVSYYDLWDLNPVEWDGGEDLSYGVGNPIEFYDRIYLDEYYGIGDKGNHSTYLPEIIITPNEYKKGGSIHIKPENRGKFNATKKRTGKTTEELTHSKNPLTRKRAIFALNAKKWNHKHLNGGYLDKYDFGPEYNMPDYFAQSLILGPMYGFGYVPPRQLDHDDLRNRQLYLESEGNVRAGSNKGAAGLFQIMPNTLQWYQESTGHIGDVFDPVYNESVRNWALQKNYNSDWARYGNPTDEGRWARAYAAYNYGAGNLGKAIRKAEREGIDVVNGDGWMTYLPDETKGYVNFIMNSIDSSRYKTQENYNTWLNSGNPYIK